MRLTYRYICSSEFSFWARMAKLMYTMPPSPSIPSHIHLLTNKNHSKCNIYVGATYAVYTLLTEAIKGRYRYCPTTANRGREWHQWTENCKLPGRPFSFFHFRGTMSRFFASSQQLNQPRLVEYRIYTILCAGVEPLYGDVLGQVCIHVDKIRSGT